MGKLFGGLFAGVLLIAVGIALFGGFTPRQTARPMAVVKSDAHQINDGPAISAHKVSAVQASVRKHRVALERARARRALAYACRPIPGYRAIITGSTIAECNRVRAVTLQKIREEQRQPAGRDDVHDGSGYWDRVYQERKDYYTRHPPHPAKRSDCLPGTHPVGQTGACA